MPVGVGGTAAGFAPEPVTLALRLATSWDCAVFWVASGEASRSIAGIQASSLKPNICQFLGAPLLARHSLSDTTNRQFPWVGLK